MTLDASRVQAILFDVDGTLADTDDQYIEKAARLIRPMNFLFPRRDSMPFLRWALMAAEAPINMALTLPDWLGVDDEIVALMNWWADRNPNQAAEHFVLMAGVDHLVARLETRYPLAVVTARSERGVNAFLDQFALGPHFRAVASAQTAPHTKPYPDPVLWAAQTLGVPAANCVMVGDTTVDILTGKRAGAQTIGVLCGLGERGELEHAGASLILERTADLADVLLR